MKLISPLRAVLALVVFPSQVTPEVPGRDAKTLRVPILAGYN